MEDQAGVSEAGPGERGSLSLSGEVPHHGNCFECVTLHRGHRDHLPMCMWDMLNERIAALSHMTEGTLYEYEKKQAACTDCEGCPGCGE